MSSPRDRLHRELSCGLQQRRAAGLHRRPELPRGLDFTSNDVLGFAQDPWMRAEVARLVGLHGVGGGASRLLRGEYPLLAEVEARLAELSGREAALLFPSGFQANVGLPQALTGAGDTLLCDALNHASLIDGARLSKARRIIYPHQDLAALERALGAAPRTGRRLILAESLYSMDGDLTPLTDLAALAAHHDATLLVDEAHATGLYGERGSGRVEAAGLSHTVLATVHTGGKALGVAGAWVAGDRVLIEHLHNHCRSFIYSTAPAPPVVAGLLAATKLWARPSTRARVRRVHAGAARLRARLLERGLDIAASASHVIPVILGSAERTTAVAHALQSEGLDVRAVRPPTVSQGTSRLRIAVHHDHDDATLDHLAERVACHAQDVPP